MGNALKDNFKLEEAILAYRKALSLEPDHADAYNNMGVTLQDQGKLEKAIEAYKKALSIKPDYAEAYINMGVALKDQGKLEEAINSYNTALAVKPDLAEAYYYLGNSLKNITFEKPNRLIQNTIIKILEKKTYVRPIDLAAAAVSLCKLEPILQKHLKFSDFDRIRSNTADIVLDLTKFPLLLKLMALCPIPDLEFEVLFTNLRCSLLSNILNIKDASAELLTLQSALALQCFTNEYIYSSTEEEILLLKNVESYVSKTFQNNEQPNPQVILILAAYKPLNHYNWCLLLSATDVLQEVITRQLEEPQKETDLKSYIPILDEITDKVSSEVRNQYEQSPYPRWVNLGLNLKPVPISKMVYESKLQLHDYKITKVEQPEILIAGCGTGQHSIGTAARFKSSNVLAIDLSLSSLAYAKRKTNELSIRNIEYLQGDILDLGQLNRQFDIIESGGVLHHMDNPLEGWKVLASCLKLGGLMSISLYSELARQHIVKIRKEIDQTGVKSSDEEMRSFRRMILKSREDHHELIKTSPDFYSLSSLKDLLFHVQEHRFTIPQVEKYLNTLGLKFCGFEAQQIISHFKQSNSHQSDPYNLDKWHTYEEANPGAFAGMYQFWCQKID